MARKPKTERLPSAPKARKTKAPKEPPVIVIKGHVTFEHLGMTATMIDGTVHFLDRSYARSVDRVENMISKTIDENLVELQGYGTLKLVVDVFSIGGNGAEIPIKAYCLNPDQMMIMLMLSRTPAGRAMRRKMVDLKNAIRDGRLVYADGGLVASESAKPVGKAVVITGPSSWPDDTEYDAIEDARRRSRGIQSPAPFIVDTRKALRIRYDHFARRVHVPMSTIWFSINDVRQDLAKLAPVFTRKEDGPLPYFQRDGGDHEAFYLTLGQTHHMCLRHNVQHLWSSVAVSEIGSPVTVAGAAAVSNRVPFSSALRRNLFRAAL